MKQETVKISLPRVPKHVSAIMGSVVARAEDDGQHDARRGNVHADQPGLHQVFKNGPGLSRLFWNSPGKYTASQRLRNLKFKPLAVPVLGDGPDGDLPCPRPRGARSPPEGVPGAWSILICGDWR